MRINERCNIVIPLYRDGDDPYAWIHSVPISNEVFEANYVLLSKTFTAIHAEGLGEITGSQIAALALRDVAKVMAGRDGDGEQIAAPFINELRRLTNVIVVSKGAWETVPFQEAITRNLLDADDVRVVNGGLTFFLLAWQLYPRNARQRMMDGAASMWGARMQSLNCTGFAASLKTSIETGNSGEMLATPPTSSQEGMTRATVTVTGPDGQSVTSSLPS